MAMQWPKAFDRLNRSGAGCHNCGNLIHEHDRERVYPEDGPPGTYHYEYHCP